MNEEKVKDLLREKGLKVTSQRLMVLNILSAHGDEHLTVEEIYDLAKEESPEIGLATIYRTVQVLLELHVIEKVTFDDGFARYELNGEDGIGPPPSPCHLYPVREGVFPGDGSSGHFGKAGVRESGL